MSRRWMSSVWLKKAEEYGSSEAVAGRPDQSNVARKE